mgnify:CR=1 FL=1
MMLYTPMWFRISWSISPLPTRGQLMFSQRWPRMAKSAPVTLHRELSLFAPDSARVTLLYRGTIPYHTMPLILYFLYQNISSSIPYHSCASITTTIPNETLHFPTTAKPHRRLLNETPCHKTNALETNRSSQSGRFRRTTIFSRKSEHAFNVATLQKLVRKSSIPPFPSSSPSDGRRSPPGTSIVTSTFLPWISVAMVSK